MTGFGVALAVGTVLLWLPVSAADAHRTTFVEALFTATSALCVTGLGRFGRAVALELMARGTEVLGIDASEDRVQELNGALTQVVRADATKEDTLRQLAVHEFDRVVIAISTDLKASISCANEPSITR
ncbi:NAD-binding protein [Microbacterium amylolyticum]|uniref:Voltage-gated potassium channel Kch n=1 Tax=Microbacterium amylolyticum TaxID=936337 RepID=A0ABS4ZJ62_9MICO|nr:voltage-gated potassium channel Kch [Microbacterium amylolyticum]